MHEQRGHGDGRAGRDHPFVVGEGAVGGDALEAVREAREAEAFVYDGGEVGEALEVPEAGDSRRVRDGGCEFGGEVLEDARVGEQVEGGRFQRVGCGDGAGADHGACFFDESGGAAFVGGEVAVEDAVEDGGRGGGRGRFRRGEDPVDLLAV